MRRFKNSIPALFTLVLMAGLVLNFGGCTQDNPLAPRNSEISGKVAQSNIGTIHMLEVDAKLQSLFKGEVFYAEEFIKADDGGTVKIGNREVGRSKIKIDEDALPQDMTISLRAVGGLMSHLEFGPHGTIFNKPVKVELSYKGAALTGIDEDNLQIFYFNQDTGVYEAIESEVDKEHKKVTAYLNHFSRYAVAWSG